MKKRTEHLNQNIASNIEEHFNFYLTVEDNEDSILCA